jgi:hypothetical protein
MRRASTPGGLMNSFPAPFTASDHSRKSSRGFAKPLSYKEPALNVKIRKGVQYFKKK